ncbi:MAG TPA: flavin reductase family protein [Roseiarcus sp.]|nr:flavin reductase family protein [Roseiarcus sp.]
MDDQALLASDGEYRQAMRAFATGVAIIACGRGVERAGCVATAVASLSLAPPSLIVNLQRDGSTYRRLRLSDGFSVNFLKPEQQALARRFSGGAPAGERFAEGAWIEGATGAPALADALASLDCRVEEILERHTHAIVIGRVAAARSSEGPALLHFRGRFERT